MNHPRHSAAATERFPISLTKQNGNVGLSVLPWRRSRRRRSSCCRRRVLRRPGHSVTIILEPLRRLERVLRGVHDQIPLVIILAGDLDSIERDGDVLLAHPEEAAGADNQRGYLAFAVD